MPRLVAPLVGLISALGGVILEQLIALGDIALFGMRTIHWLATRPPRKGTLLPSFYQIGVLSLPVVALRAIKWGAVGVEV